MADLVLTGVENEVLHELQMRANRHGRTITEEINAILSEALQGRCAEPWTPVDAIYHRFEATGHTFTDSADLLREDRSR